MSEPYENLILRHHGEITVAILARADVIDTMYIKSVGAELHRVLAEAEPPHVIIDFDRIRFLSSSALGMIIELNESAGVRGGRICIANVAREVRCLFDLTGLPRIIALYDTTEEAVASYLSAP